MGKRGPKPKPTAQRMAEGNPGNLPINEHEPQMPDGDPDCPEHLQGEARVEWFARLDDVRGRGVISPADRATFAAYCIVWQAHVTACLKVDELGYTAKAFNGQVRKSPWVEIMLTTAKQLQSLAAELGLTPSGRSGIIAVKPSTPTNPAAKFFKPRIVKAG